MANPFTAVSSTMADLWKSAGHSDCTSPGMTRTGLVMVTPLIVPFVFGAALLQKKADK